MRRYGLVDIPDEASDIGAIPVQSDSIISGGIVTWSGTGLVFNVSVCNYYIDGNNYNSPDSTLTLAASDPTNDRIDVFAVDVNGDAIVITGTPSANPQEPQTDPATQIKLTTVIVQATATTPSGVTNNLIYDENVEAWSKTSNSLTVDYSNTTTPYVGTYCILATTTSASTFKALSFYKTSTYSNKADYDIISFAIKLTQSLLSTESIKIIFSNTSLFPNTKVAEYAITSNNSLGLSFSNTSGYQLIGIPMGNINFTNNSFNYVQIQFVTSRTGISFRLDRILLQYGINQPTSPTQSNSFGFVVSNSGTATATMPTDTLTIVGTGLASTSVSGKTLTIAAPSPISGTTNYISKFTPTGSLLGNSLAYDNGTTVSIGTTSPSADNKLQVEGRIVSNVSTTSLSSSAYSILGNTSLTFASGGTLSSSIVTNAVQGGTNYSVGGNLTIPNSVVTSSVVAVSGLAFTSNSTITQSQASYIRTMGNIFAMWIRGADVSGTVTHMSNLRLAGLYSPYSASTLTVSNYYGVIIEDAAQFSGVSISSIWGIYQEGINDNNYFAGKVLIGSNTVGTESLKVVGSAIISSTVTLSNLAGSGTRMVVADGSGVLSTQAIPSGGGMSIGGSITSATAGSVLFAGTSGVLAQDNANFFWDDTNNRLGIGTATPANDLHINRNFNGITIAEVSNLNNPTGALSGARFQARTTGSSLNNNLYLGITSSAGTAYKFITPGDAYIYKTNSSEPHGHIVIINDNNNGSIKFGGGAVSTQQMTLTALGRLLLNTTTEGIYRFDVNGNGRFSSSLNVGGLLRIDITSAPTTREAVLNAFISDNATDMFGIANGTNTDARFVPTLFNYSQGTYGSLVFRGLMSSAADSGTGALVSFQTFITTSSSDPNNGTFTAPSVRPLYAFFGGNNILMQMFANGNLHIQNGGTFTDIASARLAINSTTQGFLPPRMTTTQKNAIGTPATGLIVYDTTLNRLSGYNGTAWDNNIAGGYAVQMSCIALTSITLVNNAALYMGNGVSLNVATTNLSPIYIPRTGTIKYIKVIGVFSTNGSSENWSMSVLKNGSTATTIETISVSSTTRTWTNNALSVSVTAGDYIEIRSDAVTWATRPVCGVGYGFSAYIYIE